MSTVYEFKIVREEFPEPGPEGTPVLVPWYTFHVSDDGGQTWLPSLKWYRECVTAGLPKTHFVDRCIGRLKLGASREANGDGLVLMKDGAPVGLAMPQGGRIGRGAVFQKDGPAETELVPTRGGAKLREKRRPWCAQVDGALLADRDGSPVEFPDEKSARGAMAIHAFMTRGKLGRIAHAREQLMALVPGGKEYRVWACCGQNSVRATVDGVEYALAWTRDPEGQWTVESAKPGPKGES